MASLHTAAACENAIVIQMVAGYIKPVADRLLCPAVAYHSRYENALFLETISWRRALCAIPALTWNVLFSALDELSHMLSRR